jgi:hypothetical protein
VKVEEDRGRVQDKTTVDDEYSHADTTVSEVQQSSYSSAETGNSDNVHCMEETESRLEEVEAGETVACTSKHLETTAVEKHSVVNTSNMKSSEMQELDTSLAVTTPATVLDGTEKSVKENKAEAEEEEEEVGLQDESSSSEKIKLTEISECVSERKSALMNDSSVDTVDGLKGVEDLQDEKSENEDEVDVDCDAPSDHSADCIKVCEDDGCDMNDMVESVIADTEEALALANGIFEKHKNIVTPSTGGEDTATEMENDVVQCDTSRAAVMDDYDDDAQQQQRSHVEGANKVTDVSAKTNKKASKKDKGKDKTKKSKRKPLWSEVQDASSGDVYYCQRLTRTTTWTRPSERQLALFCEHGRVCDADGNAVCEEDENFAC